MGTTQSPSTPCNTDPAAPLEELGLAQETGVEGLGKDIRPSRLRVVMNCGARRDSGCNHVRRVVASAGFEVARVAEIANRLDLEAELAARRLPPPLDR